MDTWLWFWSVCSSATAALLEGGSKIGKHEGAQLPLLMIGGALLRGAEERRAYFHTCLPTLLH
jgi:hypothetical protein